MNFDSVGKIAAAILYEGYILYPYRPTAIKNRQRWNFGTLYPRMYAEAQRPPEPFHLVAECLVMAEANASLDLKISFLQLVPQQRNSSEDLHELSDPSLAWEEAVERTSEHQNLLLSDLIGSPLMLTVLMDAADLPERRSIDEAPGLQAILTIDAKILQDGACKLHLELENASKLFSGKEARRDEALPRSFVSAHLLLGINGGEFVSLLDPAEIYRESTATCHNIGVFPVLAGEEPDRTMMLCSPIILYDYPKIAPESAGDFFDGTEMDEMLTLRVLTLTDAEKHEMRNGDPRARRILERTESLTAESMLKAHGVIRSLQQIREDAQ
jgi:hypothetical protein